MNYRKNSKVLETFLNDNGVMRFNLNSPENLNALSLYWLFLFIVWLVFFTIMFAYNDTVIEFCKSLIA